MPTSSMLTSHSWRVCVWQRNSSKSIRTDLVRTQRCLHRTWGNGMYADSFWPKLVCEGSRRRGAFITGQGLEAGRRPSHCNARITFSPPIVGQHERCAAANSRSSCSSGAASLAPPCRANTTGDEPRHNCDRGDPPARAVGGARRAAETRKAIRCKSNSCRSRKIEPYPHRHRAYCLKYREQEQTWRLHVAGRRRIRRLHARSRAARRRARPYVTSTSGNGGSTGSA